MGDAELDLETVRAIAGSLAIAVGLRDDLDLSIALQRAGRGDRLVRLVDQLNVALERQIGPTLRAAGISMTSKRFDEHVAWIEAERGRG